MPAKKPVICHITTVHTVKDTRIYHKECRSLAEAGYDVKLVAVNASSTESDYPGLEIINVRVSFNSKLSRILKANRKAYHVAMALKADCYHFHDPEFMFHALLLKKAGFRVIFDSHEDVPKQIGHKSWIPTFLKRPVSFAYRALEHKIARRFDALITVVETIEERFKTIHDHVFLIQNFPIIDARLQREWSKREHTLCYVGDLTEVRGAKQMVDSLEYVDTALQMGGRFSSKELEQSLKESSAWNKVNALGFLARPQVIETYLSSKIGLVVLHPTPSYIAALPVKLLEYMSMGLAVVGSNFGMIKDIIESHDCGMLVDPLDPKDIARAVQLLIDDDTAAKDMGERGRKAAMEKYSWDQEAKKLVEIYEFVLAH